MMKCSLSCFFLLEPDGETAGKDVGLRVLILRRPPVQANHLVSLITECERGVFMDSSADLNSVSERFQLREAVVRGIMLGNCDRWAGWIQTRRTGWIAGE